LTSTTLKKTHIEKRNGTYAALKYEDGTIKIIGDLIELWNIPNPLKPEKLHTTIIYSRSPIPAGKQHNMNRAEMKSKGWKFLPSHLGLLKSSPHSPITDVLVLFLKAPELVELHDSLKVNGASHDFDGYDPHITLSYNLPESFDWKSLEIPPIYLVPSSLYFEPLNVNWKD
jgi:hypothetical protein